MADDTLAPNPYAAPVASGGAPAADGGRRLGTRALVLLLASFVLLGVSVVAVAVVDGPRWATTGGCAIATLLAAIGFFVGVASLVASRSGRATVGFRVAVAAGTLANVAMALVGALATLLSTVTFSRGRQLRRLGRVLLPRVRSAGDWATLPLEVTAGHDVRASLAAQWRENGRTEHASVAAFARLTLDLMALGAPPALVAAANRDALDEIRHTELCFSLARALDGRSESPGPFPEARAARTVAGGRTLALAGLAVDSLVDGALHEGVSARVVAKLAKRCDEPTIRGALKEIAADEGRHAAHGWDVVEWCLAEGGKPVAHALAGALSVLPRTLRTPRPEAAAQGQWERYGIVGSQLEAEEFAKTRADLVRRVESMIGLRTMTTAA